MASSMFALIVIFTYAFTCLPSHAMKPCEKLKIYGGSVSTIMMYPWTVVRVQCTEKMFMNINGKLQAKTISVCLPFFGWTVNDLVCSEKLAGFQTSNTVNDLKENVVVDKINISPSGNNPQTRMSLKRILVELPKQMEDDTTWVDEAISPAKRRSTEQQDHASVTLTTHPILITAATGQVPVASSPLGQQAFLVVSNLFGLPSGFGVEEPAELRKPATIFPIPRIVNDNVEQINSLLKLQMGPALSTGDGSTGEVEQTALATPTLEVVEEKSHRLEPDDAKNSSGSLRHNSQHVIGELNTHSLSRAEDYSVDISTDKLKANSGDVRTPKLNRMGKQNTENTDGEPEDTWNKFPPFSTNIRKNEATLPKPESKINDQIQVDELEEASKIVIIDQTQEGRIQLPWKTLWSGKAEEGEIKKQPQPLPSAQSMVAQPEFKTVRNLPAQKPPSSSSSFEAPLPSPSHLRMKRDLWAKSDSSTVPLLADHLTVEVTESVSAFPRRTYDADKASTTHSGSIHNVGQPNTKMRKSDEDVNTESTLRHGETSQGLGKSSTGEKTQTFMLDTLSYAAKMLVDRENFGTNSAIQSVPHGTSTAQLPELTTSNQEELGSICSPEKLRYSITAVEMEQTTSQGTPEESMLDSILKRSMLSDAVTSTQVLGLQPEISAAKSSPDLPNDEEISIFPIETSGFLQVKSSVDGHSETLESVTTSMRLRDNDKHGSLGSSKGKGTKNPPITVAEQITPKNNIFMLQLKTSSASLETTTNARLTNGEQPKPEAHKLRIFESTSASDTKIMENMLEEQQTIDDFTSSAIKSTVAEDLPTRGFSLGSERQVTPIPTHNTDVYHLDGGIEQVNSLSDETAKVFQHSTGDSKEGKGTYKKVLQLLANVLTSMKQFANQQLSSIQKLANVNSANLHAEGIEQTREDSSTMQQDVKKFVSQQQIEVTNVPSIQQSQVFTHMVPQNAINEESRKFEPELASTFAGSFNELPGRAPTIRKLTTYPYLHDRKTTDVFVHEMLNPKPNLLFSVDDDDRVSHAEQIIASPTTTELPSKKSVSLTELLLVKTRESTKDAEDQPITLEAAVNQENERLNSPLPTQSEKPLSTSMVAVMTLAVVEFIVIAVFLTYYHLKKKRRNRVHPRDVETAQSALQNQRGSETFKSRTGLLPGNQLDPKMNSLTWQGHAVQNCQDDGADELVPRPSSAELKQMLKLDMSWITPSGSYASIGSCEGSSSDESSDGKDSQVTRPRPKTC